jgi:hypothetical protein
MALKHLEFFLQEQNFIRQAQDFSGCRIIITGTNAIKLYFAEFQLYSNKLEGLQKALSP